jgi:chromosomal replication initiation ATPase DnaA
MNPYIAPGIITSRRVSFDEIESCVLDIFGIEREVMYRRTRKLESSRPRKVFSFIARTQGYSLEHLSLKLGIDHSTVVYNTKRICDELDVMPDTRKMIRTIADRLDLDYSELLQYKPNKYDHESNQIAD